MLSSFETLIRSNRQVFYPSKRARIFDFLRDDVSFVTDGTETVLTSISEQFMLGFPPEKLLTMDKRGPHA